MPSPLKWLGSKRRLAPQILQYVPPDSYLVEPFAGSAALTFARQGPGWVNDANEDLIAFYRALVEDWEGLYEDVLWTWDQFSGSSEGYAELKQAYRACSCPAAFYFLNKHSYSGLWRVNKNGAYNVPYGGSPKRRPKALTFQRAAEHLAGVTITSGSYQDCIPDPGDVVYVDPPYPTTFQGYTAQAVNFKDLREWCDALPCTVLASGLEGDSTWDGWQANPLGELRHSVRKGSRRRVRECLYLKKA